MHVLHDAISSSGYQITEVVSGAARGADQMGEDWARQNGVPIARFPADWNTHGKGAGFIRNTEMAMYAKKANGGLIAIWHPNARGTTHMIKQAHKMGLKVHVHVFDPEQQPDVYPMSSAYEASIAKLRKSNVCDNCKLPLDICRCEK